MYVIYFWDAPEIVKEYLQIGDEKLQDAARDAAWAAAGDAARAAARAAAGAKFNTLLEKMAFSEIRKKGRG